MAQQPNLDKTLVTYTILSGGSPIDDTYLPLSIRVSKVVNRIPFARIEFMDGSTKDNEDFKIAHDKAFKPGAEVTVKCGYESDEEILFKGIVTKHQLKIRNGESYLVIECKDEAIKMTAGRKNEVYVEKKDSDIISEIVKKYGLKVDVQATNSENAELVQHYTSDWDFMMLRADVNNLIVVVDDGELAVTKPDSGQSPLFDVEYGTNLLDFDAEMDAKGQYSEILSVAWNPSEQLIEKGSSKEAPEVGQGAYTSADLSKVINSEVSLLQTAGYLPVASLEDWGNSMLLRSRLAKIRGTATIRGSVEVKPNTVINFAGISNTFNGAAYISGVYHVVEDGKWYTELEIGLKEKWFAEEMEGIESPNAAGLNAGMQGLQMAIVKMIHEDPEGEHRIQVTVPTLQKDNLPIWARLSNFYSTNGAGVFFMPEVGDEVVLGFLNNDPRFPVILGSVYSKKNVPMYTATEENEIKAFVTKEKYEIKFNEKEKVISITTPGGHQVLLDDENKSLTVLDEANKNSIILSDEGIALESDKDISIKAKGDVKIESTGSTEIKASKDVIAEGLNVNLKGQTKFAAEGAQAEIKGSATTTVKGGIVQIN